MSPDQKLWAERACGRLRRIPVEARRRRWRGTGAEREAAAVRGRVAVSPEGQDGAVPLMPVREDPYRRGGRQGAEPEPRFPACGARGSAQMATGPVREFQRRPRLAAAP